MNTTTSSTPVSLPSQHELRVAIALNNMAVTMMERDCYLQAFATLQDAANAVKVPIRLGDGDRSSARRRRGRSLSTVSDTCALHLANQRLSNPRPSAVPIPLETVSQQDAPARLSNLCSPARKLRGTSPVALQVIRIEEDWETVGFNNDTRAAMNPEDIPTFLKLSVAIMMFNFGIVNFCLARLQQTRGTSTCGVAPEGPLNYRQLCGAGIKLLQVSKKILAETLYRASNSAGAALFRAKRELRQTDAVGIFHLTQVLLVASLVLETLIVELSRSRSSHPKAQQFLEQETKSCAVSLARLRVAARQLESESWWVRASVDSCNTAPAA